MQVSGCTDTDHCDQMLVGMRLSDSTQKKTVSMGRNSIGYVARPTEISSLHLHMVNFISFHFKEFSIPTFVNDSVMS